MQTENDHVCFSLCGNHVLPVYCVSSSFVPCPEARFALSKQNVEARTSDETGSAMLTPHSIKRTKLKSMKMIDMHERSMSAQKYQLLKSWRHKWYCNFQSLIRFVAEHNRLP
jgi:hypothetical protein